MGRCADRLSAGALRPADRVVAVAEARVVMIRRRVIALPVRKRPGMK